MSIIYSKLGIPISFNDHFREALKTNQGFDISVNPRYKRNEVYDYRLIIHANGAKKELEGDITVFALIKANHKTMSANNKEYLFLKEALKYAGNIKKTTGVEPTVNGRPAIEMQEKVKKLEELLYSTK